MYCIPTHVQSVWGVSFATTWINGVIIDNIRYADDIVLIATTKEGLQKLLHESNSNGESKGLSINYKKTKCMVISKSEKKNPDLHSDVRRNQDAKRRYIDGSA